jgi:hypothetical protein
LRYFYTIPAVITGVVAYLLFNAHFKDQQNTRRWLIQKRIKTALPYEERLTLLMERINPSQLVSRVNPISDDKMIIKTLLSPKSSKN